MNMDQGIASKRPHDSLVTGQILVVYVVFQWLLNVYCVFKF
uniref:Uncharacterized protein n=1 Tax=Rhizophora mucronata TaxID=61149 RepID=A0A2P2IUJ9_RHIMU